MTIVWIPVLVIACVAGIGIDVEIESILIAVQAESCLCIERDIIGLVGR